MVEENTQPASPEDILQTILTSLTGFERHVGATKPEGINRLFKHAQHFALAMAALNSFPQKIRAPLLQKLAPHRVQIEHAYDVLTLQHGKVRQDILGALKNAETQKNYAQYTKNK